MIQSLHRVGDDGTVDDSRQSEIEISSTLDSYKWRAIINRSE